MQRKARSKAGSKKEPFDWGRLIFGGMVAARGLMSDDPKVQQGCADILNDVAGRPRRRLPLDSSSRRRVRRQAK